MAQQTLQRLFSFTALLAVLGGSGPPFAQAQGSAAATGAGGETLTLDQAISFALNQNLGLSLERINVSIGELDLLAASADFDPVVFASVRYNQAERDPKDSPDATTSDQRSYSAGVRKRIRTGAEVTASTALSRNDGTFYDQQQATVIGGGLRQSASLSLSVTQPLLRGFGTEITLADLRRAESLDRATKLQLRSVILDLVAEVEQNYWLLADAEARRRLRESNRELAERLLEEVRERADLGLATRLEVLQAEANLAQRIQEIIATERQLSDRADNLMASLGGLRAEMAINEGLAVERIPTLSPEIRPFEAVWTSTQRHNLDTAVQEEVIAQRELDTLLAKDGARPQLDVTLSGGVNGISQSSGSDAYDRALEREGRDWGVGLTLNYPFGSRAEQARYRRAEFRRQQAEWALIDLRQGLLRDTRNAWRQLDVARRQVEAAKLVVRLQEATFEQERGKYEEGLSTIRDVLETQTALDSARISLLDAQYDAISAEIRLERIQGLLLERHGLSWPEISPETALLSVAR